MTLIFPWWKWLTLIEIEEFLLERLLWKIFWLGQTKMLLVFNYWFSMITFILRLNKLNLNIIVFRITGVDTEMFRRWGMRIMLILKLLVNGLNLLFLYLVFLPSTIKSIPLISKMMLCYLKSWGLNLRNRRVRNIGVCYWLRNVTPNHDIILLFKLKI